MRRTVSALLISLIPSTGCAVGVGYSVPISGGHSDPVEEPPPAPRDQEVAGVIAPGKSTQRDVFELMGPPATQHQDEQGNIAWTYWSTETVQGRYVHQAMRVVFDPQGVVLRVESNRAAP